MSRPARRKLTTMSRRKTSSSIVDMNRDRRSPCDDTPCSRLCLITASASSWTDLMACFSFFSDPKLKNRLIFHINGDVVMALSADSFDARSNAAASSETGSEGLRQPGSNPKENRHMLSNENRRKTSCKSKSEGTDDRSGMSLD